MKRRWLIRSFLVLLCLLCVLVWVRSYFRVVRMEWLPRELGFGVVASRGSVEVFAWKPGLVELHAPLPPGWRPPYEVSWLGFELELARGTDRGVDIQMPMWFLTLAAAACLWIAWRRTRTNAPAGSFPVS